MAINSSALVGKGVAGLLEIGGDLALAVVHVTGRDQLVAGVMECVDRCGRTRAGSPTPCARSRSPGGSHAIHRSARLASPQAYAGSSSIERSSVGAGVGERADRRSVDPGRGDRGDVVAASLRPRPPGGPAAGPGVAAPTTRPQPGDVHVVEQQPVGAGGERLGDLAPARGTRPRSAARAAASRARRTASPTPPAIATWFSLIRIASYEADAVVASAAGGDRRLLERPQPRRRLARVEDRGARCPRPPRRSEPSASRSPRGGRAG